MKEKLCVPVVLKHLQHLPLQLDGTLLHHLVADDHRDLVSQSLTSNLWLRQENVRVSCICVSVNITKLFVFG